MNLKEYIRSIPDYPKKGILFRDITTLIKDEKAFSKTIDLIIKKSEQFKIDKIAAIVKKTTLKNTKINQISIIKTTTNDNRSYHINSDKIYNVLGFRPKKTIEDAVKELLIKFKQK